MDRAPCAAGTRRDDYWRQRPGVHKAQRRYNASDQLRRAGQYSKRDRGAARGSPHAAGGTPTHFEAPMSGAALRMKLELQRLRAKHGVEPAPFTLPLAAPTEGPVIVEGLAVTPTL